MFSKYCFTFAFLHKPTEFNVSTQFMRFLKLNYNKHLKNPTQEWIFKCVLGLLFAALLWFDVFHRDNFKNIVATFWSAWHNSQTFWLYVAILLMPLNWCCEALKWRILIRDFVKMRFVDVLRAISAGVTFSLFFPNRVGEFGGRVLFLPSDLRLKGTLSTFVGSWAQQFILVAFGAVGLSIYAVHTGYLHQPEHTWIIYLVALGAVLLLASFLRISVVVNIFRRIKFLRRFPKLIQAVQLIRSYSTAVLMRVLAWSFVRYSIYTLQYYCIIRFFGLEIVFSKALASISTIYLLQTGLPLPPLVGLMARGEIAIQIWSDATQNQLIILAATFTLWIINLIVPALLGLFFLLNLRLTKKNESHEFEYQEVENHTVLNNADVRMPSVSAISAEISAR